MPFGALTRPALGLSLLKAELREAGIACDVRYLTFAFAELIGFEEYEWISSELPHTAFAGDWIFTTSLYGDRPIATERYVQDILRDTWRLDDHVLNRLFRVRSLAERFLEHCVGTIPWQEYRIVGFTSTFEQNISSLTLAGRIKKLYPHLCIVFGGANWEGEMGQELHQRFPFVDYVCTGEADESFPTLVRTISVGHPDPGAIPGIVYRDAGRTVTTGRAALVRDMDVLPVPDFTDYFQELNDSTIGALVVPTLLIETSRGCWWGAKSQCTFCGLNGGTMTFRSKSPGRALMELTFLVERWGVEHVEAVDNILDLRYFDDFFPELAQRQLPIRLFYEVKANLRRDHVRLLREAGVDRIQPGIESLSDNVLKLMQKGTGALRNIQLLKWCKEYRLAVDWNLLYGFPGESPEDYALTLDLLSSVRFLDPPGTCAPIRLDRFSPYHETPQRFGLRNLRPLVSYKHLYPFDDRTLARIAYYFDFDYEARCDPQGSARAVVQAVEAWQRVQETGTVCSEVGSDGALVILDTRADAIRRKTVLRGAERSVYEFCDELHSADSVVRHLEKLSVRATIDRRRVVAFLQSLVANRLMVTDGVHYLSLALRSQSFSAQVKGSAWSSTTQTKDALVWDSGRKRSSARKFS